MIAAFASGFGQVAHAASQDELQSWITKNAVAIRLIDPANENFEDLKFFDVIGDAQVVQLGEASHMSGSALSANARLVKFLRDPMGFDVLLWGEGIYDMRLVQAAFSGPDDAVAAAQRGIRPGQSKSAELKPLLDYAKASLIGTHPLEMAGYDARLSSQSFEHFASDLRSFVGAVSDIGVRRHAQDLAERALAAYDRICRATDAHRGAQEDLDTLHHTADDLLEEIGKNRRLFEQVHGARETSFMERAVESMRSDGTGKFYLAQATPDKSNETPQLAKFSHQREEKSAKNLRWLAGTRYRGEKVIICP
ncbi:hypothetical protein QA640_39425 [Bradyrhizobium sp. CB82]|uniref:hypothetical protein n=1 Tax=Bradyrhizobium sp. CB82 TaxID=3039159 RepID=UPI0024B12898|nr:hypothetical protein [Bradyrhizobium sp. CB82]WFU40207.1 hypothetical protein QA640_39425 [Bradyrhizobium sp. CB82]